MGLFSNIKETFAFTADDKAVQKIRQAHIHDLASESTHEELKKASIDANVKANNKHFWSGYLNMFGNHLISSAFMAIGVGIGLSGGAVGAVIGMIAVGLALGVVAHTMHQSASKCTQAVGCDMSDVHSQRIAAFNAKALKQELGEELKQDGIVPRNAAERSLDAADKPVLGKFTAKAMETAAKIGGMQVSS